MASKSGPQQPPVPRKPITESGDSAAAQPTRGVGPGTSQSSDELTAGSAVAAESPPERNRQNTTGINPVRVGGNRPNRERGVPAKQMSSVATSTIIMLVVVAVLALGVIGYVVYRAWDSSRPLGEQRAQQIEGLVNYRVKDSKMLTRVHVAGPQKYKVSPPVGGNHHERWESCVGDVYPQQIPNEHAVHSLEHGAVWITYRPDLPADQVAKLAEKVRGQDYMFMSPYPGLTSPISLQAWGFQLKVNSANDTRIDKFIVTFRKVASMERGATCSNGVTITGDTPEQTQPHSRQQSAPTQ